MKVEVLCPSCQGQLRIPRDVLGRTIRCPLCHDTFVAEAPDTGPAPVAEETPPATPEPAREAPPTLAVTTAAPPESLHSQPGPGEEDEHLVPEPPAPAPSARLSRRRRYEDEEILDAIPLTRAEGSSARRPGFLFALAAIPLGIPLLALLVAVLGEGDAALAGGIGLGVAVFVGGLCLVLPLLPVSVGVRVALSLVLSGVGYVLTLFIVVVQMVVSEEDSSPSWAAAPSAPQTAPQGIPAWPPGPQGEQQPGWPPPPRGGAPAPAAGMAPPPVIAPPAATRGLLRSVRFPGSQPGTIAPALAFSPDGKTLATKGWDGTLRLWDVATGQERRHFVEPGGTARMVAYSPDGRWLISPDGSRFLKVREAATGKERIRLDGGARGDIEAADFSPDSKKLVATTGEQVWLWDIPQGTGRPLNLRFNLEPRQNLARRTQFTPDGARLFTAGSRITPQETLERVDRFWDLRTGQMVSAPRAFPDEPLGLTTLTPDGRYLLLDLPNTPIRLWDLAAGRELLPPLEARGSGVGVFPLPDRHNLAVATLNGTVNLWDMDRHRVQLSFQVPTGEAALQTIAFSPDGVILATVRSDGWLQFWDLTGLIGRKLKTPVVPVPDQAGPGPGQAAGPGGAPPASTAPRLQPRASLTHPASVRAVAFSPDGKLLASADLRGIHFWDPATGQPVGPSLSGQPHGVVCLAFSPDGKTLATGSLEHKVQLWDVTTGREQAALSGNLRLISAVAFSPDGKTLATSGDNVRLWDLSTHKARVLSSDGRAIVRTLVFAPDGRTLASGGSDRIIRLWDVASGRELVDVHGQAGVINSMAIAPDGKTLASVGSDRTVRLWDLPTGMPQRELRGDTGRVVSVAFSPDGKTLVTGAVNLHRKAAGSRASLRGEVKLWDTATGKELANLEGHTAPVTCVAFAPDGKTVASASTDHTVKLWTVRK